MNEYEIKLSDMSKSSLEFIGSTLADIRPDLAKELSDDNIIIFCLIFMHITFIGMDLYTESARLSMALTEAFK